VFRRGVEGGVHGKMMGRGARMPVSGAH
jgi:hypothetical protein